MEFTPEFFNEVSQRAPDVSHHRVAWTEHAFDGKLYRVGEGRGCAEWLGRAFAARCGLRIGLEVIYNLIVGA
jgi:hypothetical protein